MNRLCQLPAFILRYMRHSNAFAISSDFSAIAFSANISIIKENERNRWLIYENKAFSLLRLRLRQLSVFYLYGNKGCRAREEADWKVFNPAKNFYNGWPDLLRLPCWYCIGTQILCRMRNPLMFHRTRAAKLRTVQRFSLSNIDKKHSFRHSELWITSKNSWRKCKNMNWASTLFRRP